METEGLVEQAVEMARAKCAGDLERQQQALEVNHQAMKEDQVKIDRLIESITSGEVSGALVAMLGSKATELQRVQEQLRAEQRGLHQTLQPFQSNFDAQMLRDTLQQFDTLCEGAEPEEMQRLLRTLVHRIEWHPSGDVHAVELYALAKLKNQPLSGDKDWLESKV